MLYLVTGEFVDPGPLLPPAQLAQLIENLVIPSFEALAKLQQEKKVLAGGIDSARRAGAFILDVASNEEMEQLMMGLPFWGVVKWEITPLTGFADRAVVERRLLAQLKAMGG